MFYGTLLQYIIPNVWTLYMACFHLCIALCFYSVQLIPQIPFWPHYIPARDLLFSVPGVFVVIGAISCVSRCVSLISQRKPSQRLQVRAYRVVYLFVTPNLSSSLFHVHLQYPHTFPGRAAHDRQVHVVMLAAG